MGRGYEASASFYDGWNNLPLLDVTPNYALGAVQLQRYFPQLRSYGADVAVPLKWLTVKAEAAYLTSTTPTADDYLLYVIQLEKQKGEWSFVGGYAGDWVTQVIPNPAVRPGPRFLEDLSGAGELYDRYQPELRREGCDSTER